ncbi:sucrose-specific PTS transporter subunit IIBC [Clostridium celatum]|uniref:sucrose-specific PTS transporter subunit IIBC n=1 Tax=Clostridium celatum TaxID=36834 RepID=UPI002904A480|nr:sucrose-specific PTS transporter subunit IIBC [Clostridium celatum]MDU2266884.1 sucrose-specific PTS transporter subunit IIBC [Clostridium celatum]MDU3723000.1 sucrose-specific PTS transporter subunit IIBC [Clostridium celatum]MDU6297396.1 sucrose-specific PTS transporter subunit IIBC [Clostridium celatum]
MATGQQIKTSSKQIIDIIGGKENIISAAHCATRLRLVLKDESIIDVDKLSDVEVVKGHFSNSGQFQIIIGSGTVDEVYKEIVILAGITETSKEEVKKKADEKLNPLQVLVKTLANLFVPILPALIASGLLMGINNVLTSQDLFIQGKSIIEAYPQIADLARLINTFANAAYVFLPVLIAFSATKLFGGNPYLGAVIGMIMVYPDLLNGYGYGSAVLEGTIPTWNIFGLSIESVGYQGTVLPVIASSYILAKVENLLRKIIPEFLDNLLTPLFSVFITGLATFMIVGPIMRGAGDIITNVLMWIYNTLGFVGGGLLGFIYAPLTMTGMHHSILPVEMQLFANIAVTGGSFFLAIASCNNVAQGAAALSSIITSKDKKLKGIALTSGISSLLGITEPAMFGVNLKLKTPFYAAMIGSAVGSAYSVFANVLNVSPGPTGIIGFVTIRPENILSFFISIGIAFIVSFLLTLVLSKKSRIK